jgi:murein DD-endopeptidase MepM/ murein hydrolase activator NlpD
MAAPSAGARAVAQAPPTTRNLLSDLLNKLLPTTPPPAPATAPPPAPAAPGPARGGPVPAPPRPTTTTPAKPRSVPADAQALINSIRRTGGRSTAELVASLHQLVDLGLSPQEAAVLGMGHFPVGGDAAYNDDFLAPRFNPSFHLHQGNDIFGARGTPVRAPNDGIVHYGEEPVGGKAAYVTLADGTYYYMAHLDSFAKLAAGSRVKQGDIVGFLGDSGNAAGGATHVHFEIHPRGGSAVNPKPILDGWLDEALANIPNILASFQAVGLPRALTDAGALRRFDEPRAGGSDADLFLSTSTNPSGAMRLTELRATRGLAGDGSRIEAALADAWRQAEQMSRSVLAPVTPAMLEAVVVGDAN